MTNFYLWLLIGVSFSILEIFTATFGALIIGIGAFVAAVFAFVGIDQSYQFVIFSTSAIIAVIVIMKILKAKNKSFRKTFIDDIINNKGYVIEDIKKDGAGKVKISGEIWLAMSDNNTYIPKGEYVKIIKIEGTKLIVEKEDANG